MTYLETTLKPNKNRDRFWEVFTKYLQKYIPEDSSVLDIGAGRCEFINNIKAKEKFAYDKESITLFAEPGIKVLLSKNNITDPYDTIFMSNFLEHISIEEINIILRHIMCKQLIIFGPNYRYCYKDYWDDPTHKTALSHITLRRLLEEAGYEVDYIHPKISPYSVEGSIQVPKFIIWLYLHSPIKPFAGQMLILARKRIVYIPRKI
jgi:hypothetical protein